MNRSSHEKKKGNGNDGEPLHEEDSRLANNVQQNEFPVPSCEQEGFCETLVDGNLPGRHQNATPHSPGM